MSLKSTPSGERIHISFFGKRNVGKSSLVNAVIGQELSVVSEVKGTTTDPVKKSMELLPLGPVVIIDTPGFDDEGELGALRVGKTREILAKLPLAGLTTEGVGVGKTQELFDRPEWKTLSEACLGCGTCTFVCPTCQCYDIKDYDTGHGVQRYRCWDSCMYSDFTMMAHGNNRTSQLQRFRQRFMHKLVYFPANNDGMYSCVGCGRCVDKCPSHLNIVKVIKAFGKED